MKQNMPGYLIPAAIFCATLVHVVPGERTTSYGQIGKKIQSILPVLMMERNVGILAEKMNETERFTLSSTPR